MEIVMVRRCGGVDCKGDVVVILVVVDNSCDGR